MSMILDYTSLAAPVIEQQLTHLIDLYGIDASVYTYTPIDNTYSEVYPEYDAPFVKKSSVRILMEQTLRGGNLKKYVSLIDKIDTEVTFFCLTPLKPETRLDLKLEDRKTLTLHLINDDTIHGGTSMSYKYYARVV